MKELMVMYQLPIVIVTMIMKTKEVFQVGLQPQIQNII